MKRFFLVLLGLILCMTACAAENDPGNTRVLTRFWYLTGGYTVPQSWEITLQNGAYVLEENDGDPREVDVLYAEEILRVIEEYNLEAWDGFDKDNPYVLDGESFVLEFTLSDGISVRAVGENAFPDNYHAAMDRILEILEKEKMASMAGVYRYEGEGFGGDFTITLNADGTCSFYEGPLSSYIGEGGWSEYWNQVYLTEKTGMETTNEFFYEDGTLLFIADGSSGFPTVEVPDMGRFIKTDLPGKQIVGKDVQPEKITEFWFTRSTSTYPPFYQRYHFFILDGIRVFEHETREGGGFPQTEEDITVSGQMELSEEDWNRFLGLLDAGTVKLREELLQDGDDGPWLYLYWEGDQGVCQEFTFASWDAQAAFESFCEELRSR